MRPLPSAVSLVAPALLAGALLWSCATDQAPRDKLRPVEDAGSLATSPAGSLGEPFWHGSLWDHWGDGLAEISVYDWFYPRYGELRHGRATTVFVTETFSDAQRVKTDSDAISEADRFPVIKLNLIQDLQTGIYDYNMMTSAFVAVDPINGRPAGSPAKISFGSQEWCGHVYQQILFDRDSIRGVSHSYFEGEADQPTTLTYPHDAVAEDTILLWARGLAGPPVARGQSTTVALLPSLRTARLMHRPLEWSTATLSRSGIKNRIEVPAGHFEVETASVVIDGGPTLRFTVESAPPYRVITWETSTGEHAALLGSDRLAYWKLNHEGDEAVGQHLVGPGVQAE